VKRNERDLLQLHPVDINGRVVLGYINNHQGLTEDCVALEHSSRACPARRFGQPERMVAVCRGRVGKTAYAAARPNEWPGLSLRGTVPRALASWAAHAEAAFSPPQLRQVALNLSPRVASRECSKSTLTLGAPHGAGTTR
jgi:hypothetical protein